MKYKIKKFKDFDRIAIPGKHETSFLNICIENKNEQ